MHKFFAGWLAVYGLGGCVTGGCDAPPFFRETEELRLEAEELELLEAHAVGRDDAFSCELACAYELEIQLGLELEPGEIVDCALEELTLGRGLLACTWRTPGYCL